MFVRDVNLSGNTLGAKGARQLCDGIIAACYDSIENVCPGLRVLNLSDTILGDDGALQIARLLSANIPSLQRLNISNNNITDKGMLAIMSALL